MRDGEPLGPRKRYATIEYRAVSYTHLLGHDFRQRSVHVGQVDRVGLCRVRSHGANLYDAAGVTWVLHRVERYGYSHVGVADEIYFVDGEMSAEGFDILDIVVDAFFQLGLVADGIGTAAIAWVVEDQGAAVGDRLESVG